MVELRINLFHELSITPDAGSPMRPRARSLLAFLLLHRRQLTREHIAFRLWPELPETQALGILRRALSELRGWLGSVREARWVIVTDATLCWNDDAPFQLDLDAYEACLQHGSPAALHRALDLYAGDLLATWEADWLILERERLRQKQIDALRQLASHYRSIGEYQPALEFARKVLDYDPLRETAHRELILVHHAAGDRAAALAAYNHLQDLLDRELGVEPMHETKALRESIARGNQSTAAALSLPE